MSDLELEAFVPPGQLFTVATSQGRTGLLFSEDTTLEKVLEFVRDPMQVWLGNPAFVWQVGREFFASRRAPELPQADKAKESFRVWKVTKDTVETYHPYERFNRCSLLIKVMGCENCEHNNKDCHEKGGASPALVDRHSLAVDMDPDEVLKAGRAKQGLAIAEVTYVPPAWTKTKQFQDQLRSVSDHDFSNITENIEKGKAKAAAGLETKRGHKEDCSRCFFGMKTKAGNYRPGCDSRVRYCHGPFDSEAAQLKNILAEWDPKVEAFLKDGEFTRGQFWAIAREAGMDAKYGRYGVMLSGWDYSRKLNFEAAMVRRNTSIYKVPFPNHNYGEVRAVFEGLPRDTAEQKVPEPLVRAIWYLSLQATQVNPRNGWGNKWRDIVYRQVWGDKVSIKTAAPRYLSYGTRELLTLYQAFLYFNLDPDIKLSRGRK